MIKVQNKYRKINIFWKLQLEYYCRQLIRCAKCTYLIPNEILINVDCI